MHFIYSPLFALQLSGHYDIVVNCTGLGARDLVKDTQVFPARGHMLQVEAPWIKHYIGFLDTFTYVLPR